MTINKKTFQVAFFFTVLYWLIVYLTVFKKKWLFYPPTPLHIVGMVVVYLLLMLSSPFLYPVFLAVGKVMGKIGALVFGLVNVLAFFLFITPLAFFRRLTGKNLMPCRFEPGKESYFEPWQPSESMEKQY